MTPSVRHDHTQEFPRVSDDLTRSDKVWLWIVALVVAFAVLMSLAADASAARRCVVPPTATVKHRAISLEQRVNTTAALRLADRMRAPFKHHVSVVAAATQEDSQRNRVGGHGTSVGYLQLIDKHGSVEWRMQVVNSAGWHLRGAKQLDPRGTARLATTRRGWGLIQRVQRSGHPEAYNQWIAEASRTVNLYRATCR